MALRTQLSLFKRYSTIECDFLVNEADIENKLRFLYGIPLTVISIEHRHVFYPDMTGKGGARVHVSIPQECCGTKGAKNATWCFSGSWVCLG